MFLVPFCRYQCALYNASKYEHGSTPIKIIGCCIALQNGHFPLMSHKPPNKSVKKHATCSLRNMQSLHSFLST